MYPQPESAPALPETRCPQCHLLKVACICEKVPTLASRAIFFLLVHQRELSKGSNTGHLVLNALAGADFELWARTEPPKKLLALLESPEYQGYLLFTPDAERPELSVALGSFASDRSALTSDPNTLDSVNSALDLDPSALDSVNGALGKTGKKPVFILIDSTWQQARKIVRQSDYLKDLPRVSLSLTQQSQYRLRKNQLDVGLSTCEAAVGLLNEFGELQNAIELERYFLDFMSHYDASMSGHAVKGR